MRSRIVSSVPHFCLAIALAVALLSASLGLTRSHGYADMTGFETADIVGLEPEAADRSHSHDGEDETSSVSHSHGHNSSDHTHDTPTDVPVIALSLAPARQSWTVFLPFVMVAGDGTRLERPPRI
uniref:Uncharacterized protein n=1 Tax=Rhizobium rhizogenes TaxID=359 RepID=A0A7S4ZV28_RHIRH|nr:hypothetical protein [Rhizobium rhizogenes]QCL10594.1 hypothetical protein pC6.5d_701 [Rhizobium rhizogenes]